MGTKNCDLCGGVARMHCESDQASLCWDCDAKVHGANFLVAKHTRCLLCTACHSLTPWKASGPRLAPTFSVCDSCVALKTQETDDSDSGEDWIREGAESYDDEDEDELENQVVPWAAAAELPPVTSSSSSDGDLLAKRTRDFSDEEMGCSSTSRPSKRPSIDEPTAVFTQFNCSVNSPSSSTFITTQRDLSR